MKHDMLQMLKCIENNEAKLMRLIQLMVKFTQKKIGRQKSGKRRHNLEKVICGILYYLRTGCTWRALPSVFGKHKTIAGWFLRLTKLGIFQQLWKELLTFASASYILRLKDLLGDGSLATTVSNISIKSKNPRMKNKNCINKLILADKNGLPLALTIQKGTAHDSQYLIPLLDQALLNIGSLKKGIIHADKGFDSLRNRLEALKRGYFPMIPVINRGYLVRYPIQRDKRRPVIERTFAWLNAFKALRIIALKKISTLYEANYIAFIIIMTRSFKMKNMKTMIQTI